MFQSNPHLIYTWTSSKRGYFIDTLRFGEVIRNFGFQKWASSDILPYKLCLLACMVKGFRNQYAFISQKYSGLMECLGTLLIMRSVSWQLCSVSQHLRWKEWFEVVGQRLKLAVFVLSGLFEFEDIYKNVKQSTTSPYWDINCFQWATKFCLLGM